jgi:hypothetical protein
LFRVSFRFLIARPFNVMAKKNSSNASPLTFDLPVSLIGKIASAQSKLGLASTSEVVRVAIAKFNFDRYEPNAEEHRQISVRLPADMKSLLAKQSKKKKVSVGELLRVALDGLAVSAPAKKAAKKSRK